MADPTEAQLKAAARKALAAGDQAAAKRLIDAARRAAGAAPVGPDGLTTAERIAAAKAGALTVPQSTLDRQAGIDAEGEKAIMDRGALHAFVMNGAQGATFGFGDEIVAGMIAPFSDMTYGQALDAARDELNIARDTRPKTSAVGEIAGALIPSMGVLSGGKAITQAPTLGQAMLRGATAGGAGSAVYGFGAGEGGLQNRATDAALSGLIGFGIGGAVPAVAAGAKGIYRAGREMLANSRVAGTLAEQLGVRPGTAKALYDVVGVDDPNAIRAYLAGAPDAMLADASPAAAGALDAAMRTPGMPARIASDRVTGRAAQSADDLVAALDNTLGTPVGPGKMVADIRAGSAAARGEAYKAAYDSAIDYASDAGRRLESLLPRVPQSAIDAANKLMKIEGAQSKQIMARIGKDGTVSYSRMPDVRQLDYITRGLKEVADAADGQGKLGGTTAMGRALNDLTKTIRGALKEAVPEYGKALDVASDAISEKNAAELGFKMLGRATTRETVAEAVDGASKAEIAAMKRGVRSYIDEQLANVRAVISDHNIEPRQAMEAFRNLSSPAAQDKMKMVLGDAWEPIKAELDKAGRALALRARTSMNSATFGRGVANEALDAAMDPSLLRQGKPVEWVKDIAATMAGASKTAVNRLKADAKGELADILTRQGAAPGLLSAMENARNAYTVPANAGLLPAAVINGLGLSAVPQQAQGLMEMLLGR